METGKVIEAAIAYFENDILGFIFFLSFFQFIQSTASLHGYIVWLMHKKEQWK